MTPFPTDEIETEDVMRWDHGGRTYAIYRSPNDEFYATDGLCSHEHVHLAGGLVMDYLIEMPEAKAIRLSHRRGEAGAGLREPEDLPREGRRRPRVCRGALILPPDGALDLHAVCRVPRP